MIDGAAQACYYQCARLLPGTVVKQVNTGDLKSPG